MFKLSRLSPLLAVLALAGCGSAPVHQSATGSVHPPGWGKPPATLQLAPQTTTPTAVMFDSVTLSAIPHAPFALGGYTSGRWPNYLEMRQAWPRAHTISIAVSAANHADCLDVEPGDATPAQAPGWVRADIAAGFKTPCVYSSYFEFVDQVQPALTAAHIARSQVFEWDADYTGVQHIDAGFDGTQWTDHCNGLNLDCSLVTKRFLMIAQPPYVAPRPLSVCIHRRERASACRAAKAKIASDQRAAAASLAAFQARGCPTLEARARWFAGRLRRHPRVRRAYRLGALSATRAAIRQADCGLFSQRAGWFQRAAAAIEAAN